jgi:aspartyl-tRNA(Asn)/glutamyl-tRNA(Gln) amidotransferase subunit C
MITRKEIEQIAMLARLEFSDSEMERFTEQFNRIVEFVGKLQTVETPGVEPTSHAVPLKTPLREDKIEPCLDPKEVMDVAPDTVQNFFRVPKVIE